MTTLNFQRLEMLLALVLSVLVCGSSSAQDKPSADAVSVAPTDSVTMPEYFGVFARMKDGSLIELEKHEAFRTKWLVGRTMSIGDIGRSDTHEFTVGIPKPEIDLSQVDHFLFHFDKGISDENCALHHFHCAEGMAGNFFDIRGDPGKFKTFEAFLDLGGVHEAKSGLRSGKVKEEFYKVFCPDESAWKATVGEINRPKAGKPLVAVVGLKYDKSIYQFRVKKPASVGPTVSSFKLDLAQFDAAPTLEMGDGLRVAKSSAGKPVLKGVAGARFEPARLSLKGDFTITSSMEQMSFDDFVLIIRSAESRHAFKIGKPVNFFLDDEKAVIPIAPALQRKEPVIFKIVLKRVGDTLTGTANGHLFGSVSFPASETVNQVIITGFIPSTAIYDFTITTP